MRFERWVLPPAIAAAVFTTLAIVPPGGDAPRGLRIERMEAPVDASHPLLVRVAIEDAASTDWRTPRETTFRLGRGRAWSTRTIRTTERVPYAFAVIPMPPRADDGPLVLEVSADGFHATSTLRDAPLVTMLPERRDTPRTEHGVELRVEGGALVPDVPTRLFAHADDGGEGDIEITPSDDSLAVAPRRARPDLCGVCAFDVTVHGLDAHVTVQRTDDGEHVLHRRLPVVPGGLAMRASDTETAVDVTTAIGGQPLFVLAGDATGRATYWLARRFDANPNDNVSAHVPLPEHAAWAIASLSPVFENPAGTWIDAPPGSSRCTSTPLGERFAEAFATLPNVARVATIHDGARIALARRTRRQGTIRSIALALAAAAIAMLIALIVAANATRESSALRDAALTDRRRLWIALGGAISLLVGGAVLLSAFALRQ